MHQIAYSISYNVTTEFTLSHVNVMLTYIKKISTLVICLINKE
jgi:hypothetical protein